MKDKVESGDGLVYNPISEGLMTQENSIEYVEILEEKLADGDNQVIEEAVNEAYAETKNLEVLPAEEELQIPSIRPTGMSVPSTTRYIDLLPSKKPYFRSIFRIWMEI